jgi:rod shape determining protein RodA
MRGFLTLFGGFDVWLVGSALTLTLLGLTTMYTFEGENSFFWQQLMWASIALGVMVAALIPDYRFLRTGNTAFGLYLLTIALLVLVLFVGEITLGAQSRFNFGFFSVQPSDPAKLVLIAILAKYFSKRNIEIANFKHIIISGGYALSIFGLVFIQPDFGTAIILFFIWFGMVLVAGIKLKHLVLVFIM